MDEKGPLGYSPAKVQTFSLISLMITRLDEFIATMSIFTKNTFELLIKVNTFL